jgi:hypothetical protein
MELRHIALALPLSIGLACASSGSQSKEGTAQAPTDAYGQPTSSASSSKPQQQPTQPSASSSSDQASAQAGTSPNSAYGGTQGSISGSAAGATAGAQASLTPSEGSAASLHTTGKIRDVSGQTVAIDSPNGPQTLRIASETQVQVSGQDASLMDLAPGQEVRASWLPQEGQNVAVSIEAMPSSSMPPSPQPSR